MGPSTILVIEESRETREGYRVALEAHGWAVIEAADERSALQACETTRLDLIVQDLGLSDVDGLDILERLGEAPGAAEVPVIAISGLLSRLEEARLLSLGVVEHLFKPVHPNRLVSAVRSYEVAPTTDRPGGGRSVLVVDDDPAQGRVLRPRLQRAGFTVALASGAAAALARALAVRPDVIVSDVLMPGVDGFQLCLAVRRDARLAGIPVVLKSVAFPEPADCELALQVGASALVERDVGHSALIAAVVESLRAPPPPAPSPDMTVSGDGHSYRMIRQLERRAGQNADLAGRLALHEAALCTLADLGERARSPAALTRLVGDLLRYALDAAGSSTGAVFLLEGDGRFSLRAEQGFTAARPLLERFFGRLDLFTQAAASAEPLNVPASDPIEAWERVVLDAAGARSLLLVPLRHGEERLGLLVLASARAQRVTREWLPFAMAIAVQISQAVRLARVVAQLAEEQEKLRQITDNIQEVVFYMTTAGAGSILYISPAFETVWGRPRAAVLADPSQWIDAIHPEDRDRVVRETQLHHARGERYECRYRILRPAGEVRWIRGRGFPVRDEAGVLTRYVGTATDTTELELAERALASSEEQVRRAQKMEAVGRLASGVAHDFNNLLTVIMGYSELMLGRLDARDPLREEALEVQKAGARAADLTRQLLVFSRNEPIVADVVDPNAVLRELEPMVRRLIGEDLVFAVCLDPGVGRVKLCKGYLEQVVVNLCVNARDAMPRGGTLAIHTMNMDLTADTRRVRGPVRPGGYVKVVVSDTGTGMTEDVLSHLFEPFFTTKEVGKGTGLGLSTVYGIVHGAGGHIAVESPPGRGSSFEVFLPRVEEALTPPAVDTTRDTEDGTETLLLVEDDETVRALAKGALERHGYDVIAAANGADALLACAQRPGPVHLAITDVVMPGISGHALAKRLRLVRPDLKVLFMSGYTGRADEEGAPAAAEFLAKPFTPRSLARKVREVLDGPAAVAGA